MAVLRTAIYVAWADQRLAPSEVSAARGVATVLGVLEQGSGLLSQPPKNPSQLGLGELAEPLRELAYATAVWVALADGILDAEECRQLNGLRDPLKLSAARCGEIEDLVFASNRDDESWEGRYAAIARQFSAREGT